MYVGNIHSLAALAFHSFGRALFFSLPFTASPLAIGYNSMFPESPPAAGLALIAAEKINLGRALARPAVYIYTGNQKDWQYD